jgi:hypothetical protein
MRLKLIRYGHGMDSTGGLLFLDGEFFCYVCEDQFQSLKVAGETRIPPGVYEIRLRTEGGMNAKYADRYDFHKGMLWLQDVPCFEWIYIHTGNTDDHTEGCLLVGYGASHSSGEFTVQSSVDAYEALYKRIIGGMDAGYTFDIEILDL